MRTKRRTRKVDEDDETVKREEGMEIKRGGGEEKKLDGTRIVNDNELVEREV